MLIAEVDNKGLDQLTVLPEHTEAVLLVVVEEVEVEVEEGEEACLLKPCLHYRNL